MVTSWRANFKGSNLSIFIDKAGFGHPRRTRDVRPAVPPGPVWVIDEPFPGVGPRERRCSLERERHVSIELSPVRSAAFTDHTFQRTGVAFPFFEFLAGLAEPVF